MESTNLEVRGMNCTGCSSSVNNFLQSLNLEDIFVDFSSGEVSFINKPKVKQEEIIAGIEKLGFTVILPDETKKKGLIFG